jgi:regulatory protein
MAGRRARTGRGWDAAPPRARRRPSGAGADGEAAPPPEQPPKDPYERAREICLQQLSYRPRTRAELATALRKKEIDDDVAAAVLDRYDEVGLIDDKAFARAWVSSRHHGRGLARRALANELRQRGVDPGVVNETLDEELDGDTEAGTARSLVDRKLRSMANAPPEAVFRRLVAMLARKGYPAGVAIGAVKDALAERAASAEFANELDVDALADAGAAEMAAESGSTGLDQWVSD